MIKWSSSRAHADQIITLVWRQDRKSDSSTIPETLDASDLDQYWDASDEIIKDFQYSSTSKSSEQDEIAPLWPSCTK